MFLAQENTMKKTHAFLNGSLFSISRFYTFFLKKFDKDFVFKGEFHNFWECVYVVSGTITVSADDRVYNLSSGEIIFHKPMELHKFAVADEDGATLLIFSFALAGPLYEYFSNKVFSLNEEQKNIISLTIDYMEEKAKLLPDDKEYSFYTKYLKYAGYSEIYYARITSFIYQFFLSLADNGTTLKSLSTPETEVLKKAVRYMQSNITVNLTVEDIAEECQISISGLKRIFAKYAGISVHKYFLNLKLNEAMELLTLGKTVTEVTYELNFCSQSYFSVVFKREIGKSPSEYRKEILDKEM